MNDDGTEAMPVIDRTFAFETLPEAFRYQQSGHHFGKICVVW